MTSPYEVDDDLLAALRHARPTDPHEPSADSPQAQAMLAGILDSEPVPVRRRWPWIAVPTGLVAAAACAAVAVTLAQPAHQQQHAQPRGSQAQPDVRTAVLAAFDRPSEGIAHEISTWTVPGSPEITFERWSYPANAKPGSLARWRQLEKADGAPQQDVLMTYTVPKDPTDGGKLNTRGDVVDVEYGPHSWSRQKNISVSALADDRGPRQIRAQIASGHFTVDGRVTLDGRKALQLSWRPSPRSLSRLWVDTTTYQPIRSSFTSKVGRPGHLIDSAEVVNYSTLPATEANLGLLTPPIPPGFRQTAAPPAHPGG